jgi:hypothetical protein
MLFCQLLIFQTFFLIATLKVTILREAEHDRHCRVKKNKETEKSEEQKEVTRKKYVYSGKEKGARNRRANIYEIGQNKKSRTGVTEEKEEKMKERFEKNRKMRRLGSR